MNILLIAPAAGNWRQIGRRRLFNGKTFRFSMLPLLTVASLSPRDARITLIDEQIDDLPDGPFDLVGITAMTALAPRAYELCRHFRARGAKVVMGGYHASLNPEDALQHADAVVVGPAYGAWEQLCADLRNGALQRVYRGHFDAAAPRTLPRHLLQSRRYVTANATFATMGCRNHCRFCSIRAVHEGRFYARPVAEVVEEVAAFDGPFFMFVDDNLTQDRGYALELFRALKPLKKRWVTQAAVRTAEDAELLTAMQRAGCFGVFVGLETFNDDALTAQAKADINSPARYRAAIAAFHAQGIYVEAGVMVGFDADTVDVFARTARMLEEVGVDAIQLAIVTPLPGTPLHKEMGERIFDANFEHYDFRHVVFTPKRMRSEELQAGADWIIRRFYSPSHILRRLTRWLTMPRGVRTAVYPLALNLAYYGRVKTFGIRGYDPAARPMAERVRQWVISLEKNTASLARATKGDS